MLLFKKSYDPRTNEFDFTTISMPAEISRFCVAKIGVSKVYLAGGRDVDRNKYVKYKQRLRIHELNMFYKQTCHSLCD